MDQIELNAAIQIVETLKKEGHEAVFAGGWVRDHLMGVEPNDVDIATSATPDEVENLFNKTLAIGKQFGVIVVQTRVGDFEVATFRTDGNYTDGRRPDSIEFATLEEDAARRDFTINGMFFDPILGYTIDEVGGKKDIDSKLLRFIGDPHKRIEEDKLRMLRAARFAVKYDLTFTIMSTVAIQDFASNISEVSEERIKDELNKMLVLGKPREVLETLRMLGLLKNILPEVSVMRDTQQNPKYHLEGNVFEHTIRVMEALPENASLELIWAALLHDVGKPLTTTWSETGWRAHSHAEEGAKLTEEILRRLKFSNRFIERVVALTADHMKPYDASNMKKSTIRRLLATDHFDDLITLCKADCDGTEREEGSNGKFVGEWLPVLEKVREAVRVEGLLPKPLIDGRDLIDLGIESGPEIGKMLREVRDMQLNDELTTREEALDFAKR